MRKLKKLLIALVFASTMAPAWADQSTSQGDSRPPIILTRKHGQGLSNTPKAPDRQIITCSYDGEILTLNFVYSEGMGILSIVDQEDYEYSYNLDTSVLFIQIPVGNLNGMIRLQLETEYGRFFEGLIE